MLRAGRAFLTLSLVLTGTASAQAVFVNEFHYDNASTDANEAIEVVGPAGTDLTGWSIVLYNGNGGVTYGSPLALSGVIPNLCDGFGVATVLAPGLQNGSPDGFALVNNLGAVVQFLSYEGPLTATNGPATGQMSVDIGVEEDGLTPATSSLALTGTGAVYGDFAWQDPAPASFGACNPSQSFVGGVDSSPTVASSIPADNATDVAAAANLSVTFSETVSLDATWFTLQCATSGTVTGTTSGGPRIYTVDPNTTLAPGEMCTWTILAAGVSDLDGTADDMAADVPIDFTIAPDVRPTVVSTQPSTGASAVGITANLSVTFSEPVTTSMDAFVVSCTSSGAHTVAVSGGPTTFALDPSPDFGFLETCTLTIEADAVFDVDATPDTMAADVTVSFGTEQSIGDYYASANASSAATLRASLHAIIDDHLRFPYTASGTDTWNILELADEDPLDASRILDIYKNESYAKAGGGNTMYNREHTWPKSYGFPDDTSSNYPYTDTHMLMLSNSNYNSARNNRYYDNCPSGCTEYPTTAYAGQGGGSGVYPGNSNWGIGDRWETWNALKGNVARAVLYMDVRYEGGTHGVTMVAEPDLVVTDSSGLIQVTGSNTTGVAYMGLLTVLIQWHEFDPPDERERMRNALVQSYQGNRNPFVDHPEWVTCVFEGACTLGDGVFSDGFE